MTGKEEPPGGRTSQLVSADSCGVNRKRRWANPEKSGGAKFLGCGADLTASQGRAMFAGLQAANCGKPQDAKVGPSPWKRHGDST